MHRWLIVPALAVLLTTSACGGSVSHWIVGTRNHQGDVALSHLNLPDASIAYQLALRIDGTDAHARAGLVTVQTRIARQLFAASRFDESIEALAVANTYAPGDERIDTLRGQIEQAEIKRDIVVSNYPQYKETGTALRKAFDNVKLSAQRIGTTLKRFDYTYDSNELSLAIRDSYQLNADVTRITGRLTQYRQLVDSGIPESAEATSLAPPASLLPLP